LAVHREKDGKELVDPHSRGRVRPSTLARELERLLAEVAGSVEEVVARPHASPKSLHQLHREMRRLRHALSLWEHLLASRHQELVHPLDLRLKRLARLVGRVRDRDVMIDLIEGASLPRPSAADAESVTRLRARLRDDARTGRELLRVFLRSEADAHLFEGLRESLEFVPRRSAGARLDDVLEKEEMLRREGVRAAHRNARRRPSSARLHRLRIQVRRLRHLTEVRKRLDRAHRGTFSPKMRQLQAQLGRLHDLDIVLEGLDADLRSTEWARSLKDERRGVRATIRSSLREHRWPELVRNGRLPTRSHARAGRARS
jgi:CHAD domain-containing protein